MRRVTLVACAAAMLIAGCGDGSSPANGAPSPDGDWELSSGSPLVEGWPITLTIDGADIGGRSACNLYSGIASVDGSTITFSRLGGTDMACEPTVMAAEGAYLSALVAVTTWAGDGDRLALRGGGIELAFDPIPPVPSAELVGTGWVLESLVSGDASLSPMVGTTATLRLDPDGTLRASTGCRRVSGRWTEAGGDIVFTDLATEGECPSEMLDQDEFVIGVLEGGFRPEIDGERLTVMATGNEGLIYRAG